MSGGDLPVVSSLGARRQARLVDARVGVVVDTRTATGDLAEILARCCGASADLLVLRDKTATEAQLRAAADVFRQAADDAGALFVLNDLPGLAADVGADGVQVGQTDVHPDHARRVAGPDLLVGRTVQTPTHVDAAASEDVDYLLVGPVYGGGGISWEAGGRPAPPVGLEQVVYAARHASTPWFAGGGITPDNLAEVVAAGARRVTVGSCVTDVDDPDPVVWAIRSGLAAH